MDTHKKKLKYFTVFMFAVLVIGLCLKTIGWGSDDYEQVQEIRKMETTWPMYENEFNERYQLKAKEFGGLSVDWPRIDAEQKSHAYHIRKRAKLPTPQNYNDLWEWVSITLSRDTNQMERFAASYSEHTIEARKNTLRNSYKAAVGAITPSMTADEIDKFMNDLAEGTLSGELIDKTTASDCVYKIYVKDNYAYQFAEYTAPKDKQISFAIFCIKKQELKNTNEAVMDISNQSSEKPYQKSELKPTNTSNNPLSLGRISLTDSEANLQAKLGTPKNRFVRDNGRIDYEYPDVEIQCLYNQIQMIVSNSPNVQTSKGIHEQSTLQEVLSTYGDNYTKSSYDNLVLYEYQLTDNNNKPCMIRFAIDTNQRVKYISIRYL